MLVSGRKVEGNERGACGEVAEEQYMDYVGSLESSSKFRCDSCGTFVKLLRQE